MLQALSTLIAAGESQTLEFKAAFDKACIATLVAFANAQGGMVLVGVSDAGVVLGTTVAAICISEFPVKPVNTRGRYFKRVASAKHCRFATRRTRNNVHIGRFKTPDMIIDDRQFTDTLFEVVEQSMKFIVSHINVAFEFDGSIQRKERFAYPLPAAREALLNAIVHRSYTDPNDIQIKIFDDKITLFSPGVFYGGLTVTEIQTDNYRSSLRNKLVAEGFYLINVIEKYGSGFIRIRKAIQDYPEVQFDVQEFQGGVMATFAQKQPESPGGGVNVGVNSLLAYIQANPGQRAGEMAGSFAVTQRTIERWLKQLKAQDLIEFTGAPKTGGYHRKNT